MWAEEKNVFPPSLHKKKVNKKNNHGIEKILHHFSNNVFKNIVLKFHSNRTDGFWDVLDNRSKKVVSG